MKNSITLSIPSPCREKWEKFSTTAHGGFCGSCQKEVIDFTSMSDNEILAYFKNYPDHSCGRFKPSQLKLYSNPPIKPGFATFKVGILSLFLLGFHLTANAQTQTKPSTEMLPSSKSATLVNDELSVKGLVTSSEDNSALPGVNIFLKKDNSVGTVSDSDGKFEFPKKLKAGDILVFSFIGLETKEYAIPAQSTQNLEVKLSIDLAMDSVVMMGAVSVEATYSEPKFIQKFWNRIKTAF